MGAMPPAPSLEEIQEIHTGHLEFIEENQNVIGPDGEIVSHAVEIQPEKEASAEASEEEKKKIVIGVAAHGNERGPVEAVINLIKAINNKVLRVLGDTSLVFTVVNPDAYRNADRFTPGEDGEDGNRVHGKEEFNDTVEGRRAKVLDGYIRSIKEFLKVIVDFHSTSTGDTALPVYPAGNETIREIIMSFPRFFGAHFTYHPEHLEGIFSDLATKLGIDGFSIEAGNHNSPLSVIRTLVCIKIICAFYGVDFEVESPETDEGTEEEECPIQKIIKEVFAIKNKDLLKELAKIEEVKGVKEVERAPVWETREKIVPKKGFKFKDGITNGSKLKQGEVYATWDDGTNKGEYIAPIDCLVIMPTIPFDTSKLTPEQLEKLDVGFLCIVKEIVTPTEIIEVEE